MYDLNLGVSMSDEKSPPSKSEKTDLDVASLSILKIIVNRHFLPSVCSLYLSENYPIIV